MVCGVVGARLFYVIEYWDESFAGRSLRDTLLEIANIPEGGLVIYGGLIGAAVGFVIFVRKHRLPLLAMADLIAPSMAIGLAFGRIGCFLNGCCYGGQTDLPWHVTFPEFSSRYESKQRRSNTSARPISIRPARRDARLSLDPQGIRRGRGETRRYGLTRRGSRVERHDVVIDAINSFQIRYDRCDAKLRMLELF